MGTDTAGSLPVIQDMRLSEAINTNNLLQSIFFKYSPKYKISVYPAQGKSWENERKKKN